MLEKIISYIEDVDIKRHLDKGHSKKIAQELANYIGHSQLRFDAFMPYFLHDEYRICQRAAYTLGLVCEEHPRLIIKWMPQVIEAMKAPKHDAIIRNAIRTFQLLEPIPKEFEGEVFDLCFKYLRNPIYPIAFKAFSMTVCRKIALTYPDLIAELISVIEDLLPHGSPGVRSRGRKELQILKAALPDE